MHLYRSFQICHALYLVLSGLTCWTIRDINRQGYYVEMSVGPAKLGVQQLHLYSFKARVLCVVRQA